MDSTPDAPIETRSTPLAPIRAMTWTFRLQAIGWGALGLFVAFVIWHLWEDHRGHHQIVGLINSGQIEVKAPAQTIPMPPQAPPLPAAPPPVEKGKSGK